MEKRHNEKLFTIFSKEIEPYKREIFLRTSFDKGENWNNLTQVTHNLSGPGYNGPWSPKVKINNQFIHILWIDRINGSDELYYKYYYINTSLGITHFNNNVILEDQYYEQELTCLNADGEVSWNTKSNASWLKFNEVKNSIFGTPTNEDVGTFWVEIKAMDSYGDNDELNITLTVLNVNDAPVIEGAPGNITVIQTEPIKLDLSFYIYDVDNPKTDLSLQTSSKYIKTEGLELFLDYRNAGLMYENVTINVTDGELVSNNHYLEVEILLVDA